MRLDRCAVHRQGTAPGHKKLASAMDPDRGHRAGHRRDPGPRQTIEVVRQAKARKPAEKGRGAAKAKPRKLTERAFRTEAGLKVTIEFKRGLDGPTALAAVLEVADQLRAELGGPPGEKSSKRRRPQPFLATKRSVWKGFLVANP